MIDLDINLNVRLKIGDAMNARLEQGEEEAFKELERRIIRALETKSPERFDVVKLGIQDMGVNNVIWKEDEKDGSNVRN